MQLDEYIESLRSDLVAVAEAAGEEQRALAERLVAPLESSLRLALLGALSDAAAEISSDLAPGSVELRLRGREPGFVVVPPPAAVGEEEPGDDVPPAPAEPVADEAASARINLRLGEQLKAQIEVAAGQAGLSVNAWLVRAAASALDGRVRGHQRGRRPGGTEWGSQVYRGWVR
ncbi:toxin-antitoxin system HicB family antitoxin [Spongisporangium articulatum]|uniref:Toxin-antitoxin system HicB family antitoxin n=1 Tax=Spongisporangium articulatum TaxID=3362603 RepID=A0ABW8ARW4_9ACTN